MKKVNLVFLILLFGSFGSCNDKISDEELAGQEYIVKWFNDADGNENDRDWFQVINIHTKKYQPVPAVKEIGGQYYLAIMSRPPSFSNKVVRGEFYMDQVLGTTKPDTVFKVTKHLRDTLYTQGVL